MPPVPENEQLQTTHDDLLKFMWVLGYNHHYGGECFGITHVALLDILMNNLDGYIHRLQRIKQMVIKIEGPVQELVERHGYDITSAWDMARGSYQQYFNKRDKDYSDILAFIETVLIISEPLRFPYLYPEGEVPRGQHFESVYKMIAPLGPASMEGNIVDTNDIVSKKLFCAYYKKPDLNNFFVGLREKLKGLENCSYACFVHATSEHVLLVTFDIQNDRWILVDSGAPSFIKGESVNELVLYVQKSIGQEQSAAFATTLYSTQKDARVLHDVLGELSVNWNSSEDTILESIAIELLMIAARYNFVKVIQNILRNQKHKERMIVNSRMISGACFQGRLNILKALDRSNLLFFRDREDEAYSLGIACGNGQVRVVEFLLSCKRYKEAIASDPDSFDESLHLASSYGHYRVVQLLLEAGVSVDTRNPKGQTALDIAFASGMDDIADILIQHGASITKFSLPVINLMRITMQNGMTPALKGIFQIYNIVVRAGNTINNLTPLDMAIVHGQKDVVRCVLNVIPEVNFNDGPICRIALAMAMGQPEIARMLIKAIKPKVFQREFFVFYRPDINAEDSNHIDTGWVATPHLVTALVAKNPDSRIARAYRLKQCHDALLDIYKGDRKTFYYHAHRLSKRLQVGLSHRTLNSSSIREHCSAQDFILLHKQIERLRDIMNPAHPQYDRRAASRLYLYSGIEINPETSTLDIIRVCLNQGQDYRPHCALPSGGFNDFARAYHKMRRSL